MIIVEENKKDDQVDEDGDGIPDTRQISGKELLQRKAKLVLAKMDPEKVNAALTAIYRGMTCGMALAIAICVCSPCLSPKTYSQCTFLLH
mmetsp:Transcript_6478/g.14308  ORF Transcript_6478/g.14308 Transcript_6478/m.14308 type:complete len:90 (+) Transcript_6478:769-1038(+)